MKQSNIDYKQTSHFSDTRKISPELSPSLKPDVPEVNTKINENPYRQNVEIERDEVVLRPDLSALHKAGGNKHGRGGTPVWLPTDSFVFSDDKALAFDKGDHELMELKQGGNFRGRYNTPAKVLERNVPLKEYNRLTAVLADLGKDEISKKSAARMLDKHLQTLGNIAYLQEAKKDFPQGVPPIADGTAPVYDTATKDAIMENKQYMKYGGTANPYLQAGGSLFGPKWSQLVRDLPSKFLLSGEAQKVLPQAYPKPQHKRTSGLYGEMDWNLDDFKSRHPWYLDANPAFNPHDPSQVADFQQAYNQKARTLGYPAYFEGNGEKGVDGKFGEYTYNAPGFQAGLTPPIAHFDRVPVPTVPNSGTPATKGTDSIPTGDVSGKAENGIPIRWQFTPWQKQSQLYNLSKWAMADREMPLRSHYNATYANPYLVNPEQAVGDIRALTNQAMQAASSLPPALAQAQQAQALGQALNQIPGVRSQYDNQNAAIKNQFEQYNNSVKNDETLKNLSFDQQYWQESARGRQNFRNMRSYLGDQFMNNRMRDVEANQKLAFQLAALGPKPAYGFDFKTGDILRNDKNILDVTNDLRGDNLNAFLDNLDKSALPEDKKWDIRTKILLGKYLGTNIGGQQSLFGRPGIGTYKKGGKISNPYK